MCIASCTKCVCWFTRNPPLPSGSGALHQLRLLSSRMAKCKRLTIFRRLNNMQIEHNAQTPNKQLKIIDQLSHFSKLANFQQNIFQTKAIWTICFHLRCVFARKEKRTTKCHCNVSSWLHASCTQSKMGFSFFFFFVLLGNVNENGFCMQSNLFLFPFFVLVEKEMYVCMFDVARVWRACVYVYLV